MQISIKQHLCSNHSGAWRKEENHPTSASKNVKPKAVLGLAVFLGHHYTLALFALLLVECCSLKSLVF